MGEPTQRPVRWGIAATGSIAHAFATDLTLVPGALLTAVGSRRASTAEAFAEKHGVERAHDSYAGVINDPAVDVVYIATPHSMHAELARACFEAGKAVLCEKPLTLSAAQARDLVTEARAAGVFFAEAMVMRCNPTVRRAVEMIQAGACGDRVLQVRADLGFVADPDMDRLWHPELGASALLDVGIYPLTWAALVLGRPRSWTSTAVLDEHGVDQSGGAVLTYDSGATAHVSWTQQAWSDCRASAAGAGGRIELAARMSCPPSFDHVRNGESDTYVEPLIGTGLGDEAAEVMRCVRAGEAESPLLPWDETVAVLELMDQFRRQWEDDSA